MWGNVPGFDHAACKQSCATAPSVEKAKRCARLCDAARCPHGNGTYEDCAAACAAPPLRTRQRDGDGDDGGDGGGGDGGGGDGVVVRAESEAMCIARCRTHCPKVSTAAPSTWDPSTASNFWAQNLQDTALCRQIPDDDGALRARIEKWFSFVNPAFTNASEAYAALVESAFTVIRHRFGCLNPIGSWQEVACPHELTEVSGLRREDAAATKPCHGGRAAPGCNPSLRPLDPNATTALEWGTHEYGGSGPEWTQRYILRTDAQITQMMDCRSPDAAQCFNWPRGAAFAAGRAAVRNIDADGSLITRRGVHGCANVPGYEWSEQMEGPVPYQSANCPVAFNPREPKRRCLRERNSDTCSSMKIGASCWPGGGSPGVVDFNASDASCWTVPFQTYCPSPPKAHQSDVYDECTPGSGKSCCHPLKCFPHNQYFAQCCLGPNDPPNCAPWALAEATGGNTTSPGPRAPSSSDGSRAVALPTTARHRVAAATAAQRRRLGAAAPLPPSAGTGDNVTCGVQYVSAGAGYAANRLGKTLPTAADKCHVKVLAGYDDPTGCHAKDPEDKLCTGSGRSMQRVCYLEYGWRCQWECRAS